MMARHEYRYINDDTIEFIIESPKHGEFKVLIDEEDKERVLIHRWCLAGGYAYYAGTTHTFFLHNHLMEEIPEGKEIDHINRIKLDNRKSNLRICTHGENMVNQGLRSNNSSGYTGVGYKPTNCEIRPWASAIGYEHIGHYATKEEAALVRDKAAKEIYGDFAVLNFPNGPSEEILKIIKEGQERVAAKREDKYTSKYYGVCFEYGKWRSYRKKAKKEHFYGYYTDEREAAMVSDKGAIKLWGKNMPPRIRLNFPEKLEEYLAEIEEGEIKIKRSPARGRGRNK